MSTTLLTKLQFDRNQLVRFIGGVGRIKTCMHDSGTQVYAVEMELGPEPAIGRVGNETTVLLYAADILGVIA